MTKEIIKKLSTAARKLPYKIPPSVFNSWIFSKFAAFRAGVSKAGVMTSSTNELTIFPKAAFPLACSF